MAALIFATVLAISTTITANPIILQSRADDFQWPKTGAAFGDSFSAGIGAGHLLSTSSDGRDFDCARTNGSYPSHLAKLMNWQDGKFTEFYSCSGDVLSDIDGQVDRFHQKYPASRVDLVTLSISGNDFGFGDVVKSCVYPFKLLNIFKNYKAACQASLKDAKAKIDDNTIWDKYKQKVALLQSKVVKGKGGRIIITGYPKFFGEGRTDDACQGESFISALPIGALNMILDTRNEINSAVEDVNRLIRTLVVEKAEGSVTFINPNLEFENHRFCEQHNPTNPKGSDPDDDNVWFNDIDTTLPQAPGNWKGAHPTRRDLSEREEADFTKLEDTTDLAIKIPSEYQKSSSFHPKAIGNRSIANEVFWEILRTIPYVDCDGGSDPGTKRAETCENSVVQGPTKYCAGLSPGGGDTCTDIPANCAFIKPKYNTSPQVFCKGGTSFFA